MNNQHKTRKWLTLLLSTSFIFLIAACSQVTEPTLSDNALAEDSVPDLLLENGNELYFHIVEDESSEAQGVLVVEASNEGQPSVLTDIPELAGADVSPYDIYWALSEPGATVPAHLVRDEVSLAETNSLPQGWARAQIKAASSLEPAGYVITNLACNNNNFTSSIAGGFLSNNPFIRLDKTPANYGAFQATNATRYRYRATWSAVQWAGKMCGRAVQNAGNNHYVELSTPGLPILYYLAPRMSFQVRVNGVWKNIKGGGKTASYGLPANSTRVYSWKAIWYGGTQFRLAVDNAMALDQFDFMMDKTLPVQ